MQNAFIKSFNGRFRDECLHLHWFRSLMDAECVIEAASVWANQHKGCVAPLATPAGTATRE